MVAVVGTWAGRVPAAKCGLFVMGLIKFQEEEGGDLLWVHYHLLCALHSSHEDIAVHVRPRYCGVWVCVCVCVCVCGCGCVLLEYCSITQDCTTREVCCVI